MILTNIFDERLGFLVTFILRCPVSSNRATMSSHISKLCVCSALNHDSGLHIEQTDRVLLLARFSPLGAASPWRVPSGCKASPRARCFAPPDGFSPREMHRSALRTKKLTGFSFLFEGGKTCALFHLKGFHVRSCL